MRAIDVIGNAMRFQDSFASGFFEDLRDAPLTSPTPRGGNHPLWIAGHLAYSEEGIRSAITGEGNPFEHWKALFEPGSEPRTDAAAYPPYDEVFEKYREARARTMKLLDELDDADLDRAPKHVPAGMEPMFPTNAEVLMLIVIHQEHHFGQLADARRALGRKPLLG